MCLALIFRTAPNNNFSKIPPSYSLAFINIGLQNHTRPAKPGGKYKQQQAYWAGPSSKQAHRTSGILSANAWKKPAAFLLPMCRASLCKLGPSNIISSIKKIFKPLCKKDGTFFFVPSFWGLAQIPFMPYRNNRRIHSSIAVFFKKFWKFLRIKFPVFYQNLLLLLRKLQQASGREESILLVKPFASKSLFQIF